jgi:hypothetical protein
LKPFSHNSMISNVIFSYFVPFTLFLGCSTSSRLLVIYLSRSLSVVPVHTGLMVNRIRMLRTRFPNLVLFWRFPKYLRSICTVSNRPDRWSFHVNNHEYYVGLRNECHRESATYISAIH